MVTALLWILCDGDDEGRSLNACHNHQVVFYTQRRPGIPVGSTRMSDTCIRGRSSRQLHLALASLALATVDFARHLASFALAAVDLARHFAGFALDLARFVLDLAGFVLDLAGFALDLAGFALDLAGFALPLAGPDLAVVDLALAHAGSVLALLLLPLPRSLPKIAIVSQFPRLYRQAILLDLSLCRLVRSSRTLRGRYVHRVPHEGDGFLLNPLWASLLD